MENAPPSAEALFPSRLRAPLRSGCAWVAPIAAGSVTRHFAGRLTRPRCAAAEHAMPRVVQLKPGRAPQRRAERLPQRSPEHRLRSWDLASRLEVVTAFAARKPWHRPQPSQAHLEAAGLPDCSSSSRAASYQGGKKYLKLYFF